ncbi:MAG: hypothetical protein CMP38_07290 [Rickettsiales bacterium]|nr:hypothetical protein [Rickettsiales bacterium]
MILTKEKKFILLTLSFVLISSCETLNEIAGLNKVEIDDSLYAGTPDLILPPDFDKDPISSVTSKKNINQQIPQPNYPQMSPYQSVSPRVTNFFSPKINVESSSSPSDSLERFKQNKRFTIGEWVYSQYVDGFKRGNIYYRPVYDKGYNFSRRYVPNRNVASFQNPIIAPNTESYLPTNNNFVQPSSTPTGYDSLDQLPILD